MIQLLGEEMASDMQEHRQNIWREHLDAHWDHGHNTHTLWRTVHGLSNRAPPHTLNTSITFNGGTVAAHTGQADTLAEQHTTCRDTALHSLLLRSGGLWGRVRMTIHKVLTDWVSGT